MDKRSRAVNVVKALHNYQSDVLDVSDMIKIVCDYFDTVKNDELAEGDVIFLNRLANIVGIPHYFDHLNNFRDGEIAIKDFSLSSLADQIYESSLYTTETNKLHRFQKEILELFDQTKVNRYFLSASTSFGKTHLVYEIMHKMNYRNIVLIFPTIALLAENLQRIHGNDLYASYKIHTLSDVDPEDIQSNNIFIYTPERFLSFLEKQNDVPKFDFVFIDEVYKIDNEYIIDEDERRENERDVSYRIAAYYSVLGNADILLAGPYIEKHSRSFERFLSDNRIEKCDYNKYEIVGKSYHDIKGARNVEIDSALSIVFDKTEGGKQARLRKIVDILTKEGKNEGTIVYCSSPPYAEKYAENIPYLINYHSCDDDYKNFVEHVSREFGEDWVVVKSLKKGIGIHHGLIPKYIQKEIISFFNEGVVRALTSTTTITEGVNTSAKNLIITNNKKGHKELKRFDAKNIAGRAGRFDRHYSGRVVVLQNNFLADINADKEAINHKNYDVNSRKDEIDLFYSKDEFLSHEDKVKRDGIIFEQERRGIPDNILEMFKVVSKANKIKVFDKVSALNQTQLMQLKNLIQRVNSPVNVGIDWDGFQVILDSISDIVNSPLDSLIKNKTRQGEGDHSVLVPMLHNYLQAGFKGLVKYKREERQETIDQATRNTAKFVYNTSKYQLVKYLGVFNVMYKFYLSQVDSVAFEEVLGIDRLLAKLEYNAVTEVGRKVSDYGVPTKVLQYYENDRREDIKDSFDEFERKSFGRVEEVISRS